ncbi:MAG TPA: winged helix-turn-helix domain-containing protein [Bryobacteraceae bacterium]|nr:winged helix-turn-helix domain-containing protein [Bryobacteraceae bacterium]
MSDTKIVAFPFENIFSSPCGLDWANSLVLRIALELKRAILKKPVKAVMPEIRLESRSPVPLQRQLYEALCQIIIRGGLEHGLPLPSTRRLATALRLSRNTVLFAYEELAADGMLFARAGSGTRVHRSKTIFCLLDPDGHAMHCLRMPHIN